MLSEERGQAMVEFALVAPLFVLLVAGIIQFGVGLNFWLDMQRIANQGARWASVNCGPSNFACGPTETLQQHLASEPVSGGLRPTVEVCYQVQSGVPGPYPTTGDPVTVELTKRMTLVPIVAWGHVDLRAEATMRLEQKPNSGVGGSNTTAWIPPNGDGSGAC